ncbi:MAG: acetylornithine carbamoyltransferase, partial [Acidobacteriota bacterium]|nr:acetylornithine carbamoyltransferase [Acidobacteriota bacterium]
KGFELHPSVLAEAEALAAYTGGSINITHDQNEALQGAKAVYAKAWGPSTPSGLNDEAVKSEPDWMLTRKHMAKAAKNAIFLHCLPVRRNVEVSDDILDHPSSRVVDEAENRFHVQRALMDWLLNS